jgi:putative Mg2+ transporter-C (MgtC) family protein
MPLHPDWGEIALRLFLTVVAGGIIGLDRGTRGHAAGLRTSILVCLAASVAMIQANLLLPVSGKTAASFGVMDLMRLPLGILTGVGFIGAGTILRRGDLVTGVTTAATLWVLTVIGLCFGGGQLVLGIVATVLSVITITGLQWLDVRIPRRQRAILILESPATAAAILAVTELIATRGYLARFCRERRQRDAPTQLYFEISWKQRETEGPPIDLVDLLTRSYEVVSFELAAEIPQ